jgi:hypothetical protein
MIRYKPILETINDLLLFLLNKYLWVSKLKIVILKLIIMFWYNITIFTDFLIE